MNRILPGILTVLLLCGAATAPAAAQSLFGTRGLGVLAPPIDGRAAALGGIGIGLIGFHTSLTNPAEIGGITRRGVSAVLQPTSTTAEFGGAEDNLSATRFPVLRIIYPLSMRLVTSLAYGSYLDQTWSIVTDSEQVIGDQTVTVRDLLGASGGAAQLRFGAAYMLTPSFAIGGAAGLITGNVERFAARGFVDDTTNTLRGFEERVRWNYLAPLAAVGARWDIGDVGRIAASAMVGGDVDAKVQDGTAEGRTYGAPLELATGASIRISPLLTGNAGAVWSRPPTIEGGQTVSRETVRVGGGLEYSGVRSGLRVYPVRVGARWAQLPYYLEGEEPPTEQSLGLGFGFRLGDPANPAAVADVGVERASRSGLGGNATSELNERLWRFTFSLSLFGN